MDQENFKKLLGIIKYLDRLNVLAAHATVTAIEFQPQSLPALEEDGSPRSSRPAANWKPSSRIEGGYTLGPDFDESICYDLTPGLLTLLFDRILQTVEVDLPEKFEDLHKEVTVIVRVNRSISVVDYHKSRNCFKAEVVWCCSSLR